MSPPDAELSELFQKTAPVSPPVDMEKLLSGAALRNWTPARRLPAKWVVAALLLFTAGAGFGWYSSWSHGQRKVTRLQESVAANMERLDRQMGSLALAFHRSQEGILESQQDGIKQVANLLRNVYQARLAQLEVEVQELALIVDPSRFPTPSIPVPTKRKD